MYSPEEEDAENKDFVIQLAGKKIKENYSDIENPQVIATLATAAGNLFLHDAHISIDGAVDKTVADYQGQQLEESNNLEL